MLRRFHTIYHYDQTATHNTLAFHEKCIYILWYGLGFVTFFVPIMQLFLACQGGVVPKYTETQLT